MGWSGDALGLALAFYVLWALTGAVLVILALRGRPRRAASLVWVSLVVQLLVVARAAQVGFTPLVVASLALCGCGALALYRLRRAV